MSYLSNLPIPPKLEGPLVVTMLVAVALISVSAPAEAQCRCDRGWDFWGNPIPINTTFCGYQVCGLDDNLYQCNSSGWGIASFASCQGSHSPLNTKFGVNSAISFQGNPCDREQEVRNRGMGYYLEIAFGTGDVNTVIDSVRCAINNGVLPIIRICTAGSCGFRNVNDYVNFLIQVDNNTNGLFYAIAGPNEPLTEQWVLPSPHPFPTPGFSGYSPAVINDIARANAQYMNAVISGVGGRRATLGGQIALLSPALNCTNPQMSQFVGAMHNNGAAWTALSGIAGNSYNVNTAAGLTVTKYLNDCRFAFSSRGSSAPYNLFFITETGAFESERSPASTVRIPHSQALNNLRAEVDRLRTNRNARAVLFFNGFGLSSDPNFAYGDLRGQWDFILGGGGGTPSVCPCSSDPSFDNFCFYGPSTAGCSMTFPGGYCDPNGDGSYSDADWVRGWSEYNAQCP